MKLKQNSFETVLKQFCSSFISLCGRFYAASEWWREYEIVTPRCQIMAAGQPPETVADHPRRLGDQLWWCALCRYKSRLQHPHLTCSRRRRSSSSTIHSSGSPLSRTFHDPVPTFRPHVQLFLLTCLDIHRCSDITELSIKPCTSQCWRYTQCEQTVKLKMQIYDNFCASLFADRMYRMVQKTGTLCFVNLNFVKWWPIFHLSVPFLHQMFNVSALLLDDAFLKCVVTEVALFSIVAFKALMFHKVV